MTITLPPDIEGPLAEQARLQGMNPESLAVEALRRAFAPSIAAEPASANRTLYDRLAPYLGVVEGSGESLSENSSERFAEGLLEKKRHGHL